ncbi:hypothetical protein [Synechococcus sp. 1G10]|uniref:hypothetical protein n=1 Tax=Synechococcus sp. 1G10 TaxID=2025605 RepID=UPI001303ACDE|nr:hypothetical protein [Synechococcus sp. 1G10]
MSFPSAPSSVSSLCEAARAVCFSDARLRLEPYGDDARLQQIRSFSFDCRLARPLLAVPALPELQGATYLGKHHRHRLSGVPCLERLPGSRKRSGFTGQRDV